jgi:hypothetical protein
MYPEQRPADAVTGVRRLGYRRRTPMRLSSDGTPRDPRILCIALALHEALPVLPAHHGLRTATDTMVREAEQNEPDPFELAYAWEAALTILNEMAKHCRIGPLGHLLIDQLETRPFSISST